MFTVLTLMFGRTPSDAGIDYAVDGLFMIGNFISTDEIAAFNGSQMEIPWNDYCTCNRTLNSGIFQLRIIADLMSGRLL